MTPLDRRTMLRAAGASIAAAAAAQPAAAQQQQTQAGGRPAAAVAFDAYGTLFDVFSVAALAERLFPGQGNALSQIWRTKQLEYSWLRTMSGQYKPFWGVTEEALVFATRRLGLELTDEKRRALMDQYLRLDAFPENLAALRELKGMGARLAVLSNGSPEMLEAAVRSAGMEGIFEALLSVDRVRRFKTMPEVYRMGEEQFGRPARDIVFVSSNAWDAIGATWYGYTAFWVNRAGAPLEELGARPAGEGRTLTDLAAFIGGRT